MSQRNKYILQDEFLEWREKAIQRSDCRVSNNFNKLLQKEKNTKVLFICLILMLITLIVLCIMLGYNLKKTQVITNTITNEITKPVQIINQYPTKVINTTNNFVRNIDKTKHYEADEICNYVDVKNEQGNWERRGKCRKIK